MLQKLTEFLEKSRVTVNNTTDQRKLMHFLRAGIVPEEAEKATYWEHVG